MARGLTDYLDDWKLDKQSGDERKNSSGANSSGQVDGADYDGGNPYRWPAPISPEYGIGPKEATSYGHSDDVKDTGPKSSAWGMSREDQARGYESGDPDGQGPVLGPRQVDGSFPQGIPQGYTGPGYDRGTGSDVRSREFSEEGKGFDGRGQPKSTSNPGGQSIGSRENLG
jgi:hypothetical protein